jgi:GT2 family glycosyltransferase
MLFNGIPVQPNIIGPQRGVSANRNCAVNAVQDADLVAFVDDDIIVASDFIANAIDRYTQMPSEKRNCTFITGGTPTKLSFRGYFHSTDVPQCVDIHAAVFPRGFFEKEQWDEAIFFGYEDAELCLRAIKQGYRILHCPELSVIDTRPGKSTLQEGGRGCLTDYQIYIEAARLYVGIKRYKYLYSNPFKLIAFLTIYFSQMTIYLLKKGAFKALPQIIQRSHVQQLLLMPPSGATRR